MNKQQYFTNRKCELHSTWISQPSPLGKKQNKNIPELQKIVFVYRHLPSFHIPNSNFTPCHAMPCHPSFSLGWWFAQIERIPLSTDSGSTIPKISKSTTAEGGKLLPAPSEFNYATRQNRQKKRVKSVKFLPPIFCEVNICFKNSIELPPLPPKSQKYTDTKGISLNQYRYQVAEIREGHFA